MLGYGGEDETEFLLTGIVLGYWRGHIRITIFGCGGEGDTHFSSLVLGDLQSDLITISGL